MLPTFDFLRIGGYLKLCFQGLSVLPCWADFVDSRSVGDTVDHRIASSLLATAQTLLGSPAPYSSHSVPPSGKTRQVQFYESLSLAA